MRDSVTALMKLGNFTWRKNILEKIPKVLDVTVRLCNYKQNNIVHSSSQISLGTGHKLQSDPITKVLAAYRPFRH